VILVMRMLNLSKALQVLNLLKQLYWETMIPGLLNSFLASKFIFYSLVVKKVIPSLGRTSVLVCFNINDMHIRGLPYS
jgi:hypothetical protein